MVEVFIQGRCEDRKFKLEARRSGLNFQLIVSKRRKAALLFFEKWFEDVLEGKSDIKAVIKIMGKIMTVGYEGAFPCRREDKGKKVEFTFVADRKC